MVRRVEWCVPAKAFGEIGVREKRHAECHRVGLARGEDLIGSGQGKLFIGDIAAPEEGFQLRTDAPFAKCFAGAYEGDAPFAQFPRHIPENGQWIGVPHVMCITPRGQMHSQHGPCPKRTPPRR